ncbi:DUF4437 domain-containing protein [Rhizobium sp. AN80A]|uniref:DUF4437 domain-containing protein n=1 Tax=Rhizobium sp. AN80A TaxID=3040673 RepID=UPI0024B39FC6|nr:DUF4437 domain-containing protein [Rhizobium sp. AN80A]
MYKFSTVSWLAATAIAIAILPTGVSQAEEANAFYSDSSKAVPVTKLEFYQNKEGLTIANGWGDPASGPHSNFIKIVGGEGSTLHSHSSSYYGVVISGVVANEAADSKADQALAAGSYWYQKGGEPHYTKCLSQTECLFFVTSPGAFDYIPTPSSK